MVRRPSVFLMDEPLSNLDAKLRVQMRAEIAQLHRRLGATFIYVTHDQVEAMTMSNRVAVMLEGQLLQVGAPGGIYADPDDRRVAEFVGSPRINMLPGTVRADGAVDACGVVVAAPFLPAGMRVTVGIRAEGLSLVEMDAPGVLQGIVRLVEHLGADLHVHLEVAGCPEAVILRASVAQQRRLSVGAAVAAAVSGEALLFDAAGHRLRAPAWVQQAA